ncbi:MAG: hypothetical protein VYB80_03435 [Actinomycetota bacterium]|nr:hypothetical protein [Actinomycetota bacterium]
MPARTVLTIPASIRYVPFFKEKTPVGAAEWHLLIASNSATLHHFPRMHCPAAVMSTILTYAHLLIFTPVEATYK